LRDGTEWESNRASEEVSGKDVIAVASRKDLRFYDCYAKLVLCGEVKLPGTLEGRSAFAEKLIQDALAKAHFMPDLPNANAWLMALDIR